MDCTSSDGNSEKSLEWFPGTPQQEKQFRKWIEEADEPLCLEDVEEWLVANANNLLEGDDGGIDLEQLSNNIARDFQRVLVSHLLSSVSNLGVTENLPHSHHQTSWLWISS